jgi:hypothetical protein
MSDDYSDEDEKVPNYANKAGVAGGGDDEDDALTRGLSKDLFSQTLKAHAISKEEAEESYRDERFQSQTSGRIFPTVILSHLGPVRSQVDSGSKWLKRQQRIIEEVAKAQQTYCKALHKVVEHEKAKVKAETDEAKEKVKRDKMKRMWNAQMGLYGSLEKSASVTGEQAKILNVEVVQPLLDAWKDNQKRVKEIYKEAETILKNLNIALQKVKRMKEKAEQAISTRDAAIVREKKEQEASKGGKRSLFSRLSDNISGNVPQNEAKVKAAKQAYEESIVAYNEAKAKWESEQLVNIQGQLELLERDRIQIQKKMCEKLVEVYNKQAMRMKTIADEFETVVQQMDTELDVRTFALDMYDHSPHYFFDILFFSSAKRTTDLLIFQNLLLMKLWNGTLLKQFMMTITFSI